MPLIEGFWLSTNKLSLMGSSISVRACEKILNCCVAGTSINNDIVVRKFLLIALIVQRKESVGLPKNGNPNYISF